MGDIMKLRLSTLCIGLFLFNNNTFSSESIGLQDSRDQTKMSEEELEEFMLERERTERALRESEEIMEELKRSQERREKALKEVELRKKEYEEMMKKR